MILDTARLHIRPLEERDVDALFEFLSDPNTMTFFVEGTYTKEVILQMIQDNITEKKHYGIIDKQTNKLIGKLVFYEWFMEQTYEIGWIMNSRFTNQGYTTEAASEVLRYGFSILKAHRIIATCQPENIASKRICEKLGMRLEGLFKKCIYVKPGIWWDELFYAILEDDYKKE